MPAPSVRAVTTNTASNGSDISLSKPSGTADGDMLIVGAVVGGQTIAGPSGFTAGHVDAANDFGVWYKQALSEGASYGLVTSGGVNPRAAAAFMVAIKDWPPGMVPTFGAVTKQTSTEAKGVSITPAAQAAIVLHVGACSSATSDSVSSTPPPGMKERADVRDEDNSGGSDVQCQITFSDAYILPYRETGERNATLSHSKANWGLQVILYQTPLTAGANSESGVGTLVELTYWDEGGASEEVKTYSDVGVIFTGNEHYPARLLNSVEVSQQAANSAAVGGLIATSISDLVFRNDDGELDTIYRRMLSIGRVVVIKTLQITNRAASDRGAGALSSAVVLFTGIVAGMTPEGTSMRVHVGDLSQLLNVPLQPAQYSGGSGFGGGAEKKGLTKPALFGRCYNLLPEQLGTVSGRETFQVHSTVIVNMSAVYIRGVEQTPVAGVPGIGEYRALLTDGGFELGASADGDVTCTAKGDTATSYANQHGEIIDRMLKEFGPVLTAGEVESSTFTAVDAILPGEIGIYFPGGDRSTARDAIRRVAESGGIWVAGGRNGKVRLSMAMPVAGDRIRLRAADIRDLQPRMLPSSLQPAPHKISVETERNWHPLQNIAPSVIGGQRRQLAGLGRTVYSASTAIATRQKTSRTWPIVGLWFNDADGQRRADQIMAWIEPGLVAFEVTTNRYPNTVEIGMGCEIDADERFARFGIEGGFAGIVVGWREAPAERRLSLFLIG